MPNSRYKSYENYDDNTARNPHYGEGRRLKSRNRDYFDDEHEFEDNAEANFSYADDDNKAQTDPDRTKRSLYNGGHGRDNELYYDDFEVYDPDRDQKRHESKKA